MNRLFRSASEPLRGTIGWEVTWRGPDKGLVWCWELGRLKRVEETDLATRAEKGELMPLVWKGGVDKKLKLDRKPGTLNYLAMWQGLRGDDLNIDVDGETSVVCSRTGQCVVFSARVIED